MVRDGDRGEGQSSAQQWLLGVLGFVATAITVGYLIGQPSGNSLVAAGTVLPAITLLAYGAWFGLQAPESARGGYVFGWAVFGAVIVLVFDLWGLQIGAYDESVWIEHVVLQHTATGALAGSIIGTYGERDHWRARSQLRLQRALDAAMDGVAVFDDSGRVSYANEAFQAYYDADDEDLVDRHWEVCYPSSSSERIADVIEDLEADERTHWRGTVVARRADGRTYPQELSLTRLDESGFVLVCRDVTGRENQDQRLQVLNRVLRHNVRNSLNIVLGRARRLADRHGNSEDVESIVDAAEDVLETSEKARLVERSFEERDGEQRPLESLVEEEVDRARSEYPETTFDVTIDCEAEVDAHVRFALRELLQNAAQHNDADDPRVRVTVHPDLRCHVSDNGSGIPEHEQQALEGNQETQLEHASGIGLWLVYWLVNRQDGAVDITEDGGVTIHLDPGKN
jgi:PAS domain S-box-containing protein